MLRSITLVLTTFLVAVPASAADWALNFGTAGPPAGTTFINSTSLDGNGNVFVAGTFTGATLTLGATTLTRIGVQDAFLAKLDANQNVIWAQNVGGAGATAYGQTVSADGSGDTFLAGCFQDANLTTPALTRIGTLDSYVTKFNSSGGVTWARNFGGAGASACGGRGLRSDGIGNVYLTGSFTNGNLTTPPLARIGVYDAYAIKLDSAGSVTWSKNFGGSAAWAISFGSAVDGSGNLYLGGYIAFANLTTPAVTRIGNFDAYVLKLNAADGTVAWVRNFGGTGGAVAQTQGIGVTGTNVYVTGTYGSSALTTPALARIGTTDAFAFKLDAATGALAWARGFGGAGATTQSQGLAIDGPGNVTIGGGFFGGNLTTPPLTAIGTRDAFVIKLDAAGNRTFLKNFGGSGASAQLWGFAADGLGNVYLGGYFSNANLTTPPLTRIGAQDALILKQATASAQPKLDVDGNSQYDAQTDGLLIVRYLFGLTGDSLTGGAIGASPTRSTSADVVQYLDGIRLALDVDLNGQFDPLTDGLIILRYMFGLRGDSLISGAIGAGAMRNTSVAIEGYLAPMTQ